MASLKSARTWGGFGAILSIFYMTYFIGFIMKLFAVKELAEYFKEKRIMSDYLWAALLNILGNLVMMWAFYSAWDQIQYVLDDPEKIAEILGSLNWWFFLGGLLILIGTWYLKRSYDRIAVLTGVKTFSTAALMYLIGAVFIFFFIGYFLIMVGAFLEIMAFFGLPQEAPEIPEPLTSTETQKMPEKELDEGEVPQETGSDS
jgi:uncharacterized membrane protein